jgi:hypothetical protein
MVSQKQDTLPMVKLSIGSVHWIALIPLLLLVGALRGEETKWIAVGDLHNWYSEAGCEIEVGRTGQISDQQDGLRWPAFYPVQDNQAAKALWIGAENFYDPIAEKTFEHKVVHVGPRFVDTQNETMPVEFTLYGRYEHPNVFVDGDPATDLQYMDEVDVVDENLPADRVLVNVVQTSMGIRMTRKIYAFTNKDHSNYHIFEYTFVNNGCYDPECNQQYDQTLEGVYFFFQYRYSISREGAVYDGNWLPQSAAWGHNTMNDVIGENPDSPAENDRFYDDGEIMRALFSWHGYHSQANFDNIGAPNVKGDGHLGAAQFVGVVTIHADKSATDKSDDLYQPSTSWYVGSDYPITDAGSDQYNATRMNTEYQAMSAGHPPLSHAEEVGSGYANLWAEPGHQNPGGYSQGQGFGPYTLAPGDSIHIVLAEAAAGLSREKCYEVGANWMNETNLDPPVMTPTLQWMNDHYLDSGLSDRHRYKNLWVFTGLDSLIQTFKRARENYLSGFAIAQPPAAPSLFEIVSGGDRITLSWSEEAELSPGFLGYKITRLKFRPDTTVFVYSEEEGKILDVDNTIAKIWEIPSGTYQLEDMTANRGFDYYYFLEALDDGSANNGIPLHSSVFLTRTNKPASLKRPPGKMLSEIRIVPNPFNLSARDLQYGISAPDRIMFLNIPPICTIRIFTERGDLIKTIQHTDGSGDEAWNSVTSSRQVVVSGLYIAHFETPDGQSAIRKFVIIR